MARQTGLILGLAQVLEQGRHAVVARLKADEENDQLSC